MYPGQHAITTPEKPAIIMAESGETLTFGELDATANRLAHLFRSEGLQAGDHVAFLLENTPRVVEVASAAERSGLYYTPVNSHLTPAEVAYIIDDSESRIVVTSTALAEVARAAARLVSPSVRWLCAGLHGDADPVLEPYSAALSSFPVTPLDGETLGQPMFYTSGTTGQPKGVWRPGRGTSPGEMDPGREAAMRHLFRFREGMTYLSPAPLYHGAPLASVGAAMRLGSTAVVMERFDAEQFLQLVNHHSVTHSQVVPTMFVRMLALPEDVRSQYDLSSLEAIIHAAAPCPVDIKHRMIEWLGPILYEYYGATESNGSTFVDSEDWLAHPGTVGQPALGSLVCILDDDGNQMPTGEVGLVYLKGRSSFEYYGDRDKTLAARGADGFSTVGDLGYLDDEGYLFLTDRRSDMIISGGVNIYPQEAENVLVSHPDVFDVAVIGVPDPEMGQQVKAVVQLVEGRSADSAQAEEIVQYCRERLAHFKCPRSVDFVEEVPRLPNGKLYKRLLRDRYWQDA